MRTDFYLNVREEEPPDQNYYR